VQTPTKIVVRSQVAIAIKLSFDFAKDDDTLRLTDPAYQTGGQASRQVGGVEVLSILKFLCIKI